ncbi:membrane protein insertase YidC [Geobacter sp. AOG1]|uniref:membrane protein insertase YidC n=1 Tax=Geobacter sp. AOG1 TaxID=1566346 RepID=UPI001CC4C7FE|nr:membrane protein insertase YidC [Geobacter sp. AOG1]GFE56983.1 membrane protein insertase YidC [Geobacter sp. AOG1]
MEKRALIAVVLSIAVLYGYSLIFPTPKPTAPVKAVQKQVSSVSTAPVIASSVKAPDLLAPVANLAAKDVTVETDTYTAVFSTAGGALRKIVLKQYKESAVAGSKQETLLTENSPVNYNFATVAPAIGLPIAAVFSVDADTLKVAKGERKSLTFVWTSPQGNQLRKVFTFAGDGYAIDLEQQLSSRSGLSNAVVQLQLKNRADTTAGDSRFEVHGPVTLTDDAVDAPKVKDLLKGAKQYSKNILWTGFGDKYFFSGVLAKEGSIAAVAIANANGYVDTTIISPPLNVAPGGTAVVADKIFIGPKSLDVLKAQGSRLEAVIDLGWFSMLAKPLLHALKFFHGYTHNYGVAIIIITVILKLIFFPLTHKSYKSMKEMQKLQPKMTELREKFKNDRDAMNKAIMELYQTHKVNPMGGCLPMVVQIPVFFALYKALMFSIELRHAPFMLWITDLAGKDPYYVTPIIMGATMFIQQKMTPTNMDPVQAKMMLALPVVFTFMFLNFPSGLVLYWLVNNILTIAQQMYINKSLREAEAK